MMLYPDGGVVDDLLVYRMSSPDTWLLVVNASNVDKDEEWIRRQSEGYDVAIDNASERWGQIALQGPKSECIAERVLDMDVADLTFYTFKEIKWYDAPVIVSRTGYTGEDGFEFYAAPEVTARMWDTLLTDAHVRPCGLGCRDTLRFEAGLPLYGHELSADISPVMAGLSMFVKMDKPEFVGKEAVVKQKRRRDGAKTRWHRVARQSHSACRLRSGGRRRNGGRRHDGIPYGVDRQKRLHGACRAALFRTWHGSGGAHPQKTVQRDGLQKTFLR